MDSPLENPFIRYGIGLSSAALLALIAFVYLEGTVRWLVAGFAVVEIVFVPQLLRTVAAQDGT